ncbi:MAG: hypothetical protein NVSMB62_11130 [Acidobacteriaceae bacterium]
MIVVAANSRKQTSHRVEDLSGASVARPELERLAVLVDMNGTLPAAFKLASTGVAASSLEHSCSVGTRVKRVEAVS